VPEGPRILEGTERREQLRLVEFTSEFIEPDWCEKGRLVLVGDIEEPGRP